MTPWHFQLYRNAAAAERGEYRLANILSLAKARQAYEEIRSWPGYAPTPLRELAEGAARAGVRRVYYKDEASRFGLGSFKALGGAYAVSRLLQDDVSRRIGRRVGTDELRAGIYAELTRDITVACATDGNHGRSVAAGAKWFGCRCTIFLSERVSQGRERAIAELGASVVRTAGDYDDSVREAQKVSQAKGWRLVADTSDDPQDAVPSLVTQGYASLLIETLSEFRARGQPPPSHLFVQGGVGALAAAAIAYLWEELDGDLAPIFVIVEPSSADCLYQSALCGRPAPATGDLRTVMAGLACGEVSRAAWPIVAAGAEFFMTIRDEAALECMRLLREGRLGGGLIVAGESGVAGLAGLLAIAAAATRQAAGEMRLDENSMVLLIGTEGATDPQIYASLVGPAAG